MTRVIWSPAAVADLESTRAYIARDSPSHADIVVRRIVAAVERLASFPKSGRMVPEFARPALREVIVRPYRVVYRLRRGKVEIAAVTAPASWACRATRAVRPRQRGGSTGPRRLKRTGAGAQRGIAHLPPGRYALTLEAPGRQQVERMVEVSVRIVAKVEFEE